MRPFNVTANPQHSPSAAQLSVNTAVHFTPQLKFAELYQEQTRSWKSALTLVMRWQRDALTAKKQTFVAGKRHCLFAGSSVP